MTMSPARHEQGGLSFSGEDVSLAGAVGGAGAASANELRRRDHAQRRRCIERVTRGRMQRKHVCVILWDVIRGHM